MDVVNNPDGNVLARRVHNDIQGFVALHNKAKGRAIDPDIDGFEPHVLGMLAIAPKFQARVAGLVAMICQQSIVDGHMSQHQKSAFLDQAVKGASAVLVAIPVAGSKYYFSNPEFGQYLNRRFLNQNFNADFGVPGDVCGISGCTVPLTDSHLEACKQSGILAKRSDAFKAVVIEMLEYAKLPFQAQDCKFNRALWDRLVAADAVTPTGDRVADKPCGAKGRGIFEGGDMYVESLFTPRDQVVIDFTVVSERIEAKTDLPTAEQNKVRLYQRMYQPIGVRVLGVALNLAGAAGPALVDLVKRCCLLAGNIMPVWANWSAGGTPVAAWLQRIVCAVQAVSANCVITNVSKARSARLNPALGREGRRQAGVRYNVGMGPAMATIPATAGIAGVRDPAAATAAVPS